MKEADVADVPPAIDYLAFDDRRFEAAPAGSNICCKDVPRAIASCSRVMRVGFARPFSINEIAFCSKPIFAANSDWLKPRSRRSDRTLDANDRIAGESRDGNLSSNPFAVMGPHSLSLQSSARSRLIRHCLCELPLNVLGSGPPSNAALTMKFGFGCFM